MSAITVVEARAIADVAAAFAGGVAEGAAHVVAIEPGKEGERDALVRERERWISQGGAAPHAFERFVAAKKEALQVRREVDLEECRRAIDDMARATGGGASFAARAVAVGEELVENAVRELCARGGAGSTAAAHAAESAEATHVAVDIAADTTRVAIGVRDPFGALDAETALQAVAQGFRGGRERPGRGAGLGLAYVLGLAEELSITVEAGRATELVAVVHRRSADAPVFFRAFDLFVRGR